MQLETVASRANAGLETEGMSMPIDSMRSWLVSYASTAMQTRARRAVGQPDDYGNRMNVERLVSMVNPISLFFESQPIREKAVSGVLDHVKRFWDSRMRDAMVNHLEAGGEGLRELVRAAIVRLAAEKKHADA